MATSPTIQARALVYLCAALGVCGCKPSSTTPPSTTQAPATLAAAETTPPPARIQNPEPPYKLPDQLSMKVRAERAPLGEVSLKGTTNLPDGLIIGVDLTKRSPKMLGQAKVMVRGGTFSSEPFTNGGEPWAAGTYSVHLYAYFNGPWRQPASVLAVFGEDGKLVRDRRDPLLELVDPELKDSEVIFSYKSDVVFEKLSPEARAVLLVKKSTHAKQCGYRRTVPVGEWAEQLRVQMNLIGTWEARASPSRPTYDVVYRYRNTKPPHTEFSAEWTADLTKSAVKMQNREAKNFSCIDADD